MENPDFTRRREGVTIQGAIGKFLMVELFTMQECEDIWERGEAVPLDLVPPDFWREPGAEFPRYSAEMLGPEF